MLPALTRAFHGHAQPLESPADWPTAMPHLWLSGLNYDTIAVENCEYRVISTDFPKSFPERCNQDEIGWLPPICQAYSMLARTRMPKKAQNSGQTVLSFPGPADDTGGAQVGTLTGVVTGGAATALDLGPYSVLEQAQCQVV